MVENQPGAGGVTAARSVTNAPPDGYTIGWFGNNTAISVSLFETVHPARKPSPSSASAKFSYLFVTNATSSYKTLQDVISTAKSKPGTIAVGTSSAGTSNHLTALLFKSMLNLDVTIVPYRGPSRAFDRVDPQGRRSRRQRLRWASEGIQRQADTGARRQVPRVSTNSRISRQWPRLVFRISRFHRGTPFTRLRAHPIPLQR